MSYLYLDLIEFVAALIHLIWIFIQVEFIAEWGDRTKTGSNSVLVAPITVGNDVYIAAGSTVTEDVPDDSLVIARSRQVVKPGWKMKTDS